MQKRMTRQEWESYIPHGYAEMRDGVPYLLYLSDNEGTVWGPVEFTDTEIQEIELGQRAWQGLKVENDYPKTTSVAYSTIYQRGAVAVHTNRVRGEIRSA